MTFDLDAVANEAEGEPFEFTFGGESYTLAASVDVRAAAMLQVGRLDTAFRLMLGEEQWERMTASPAVFNGKKLDALLDAYGKHIGISLGESAASTDS